MRDRQAFDNNLAKLGTFAEAGYFLALHIRFTSPIMFFQTYPEDWQEHYTRNGYVLRDPVTAWCFVSTGTTRWSNKKIPDPFGIFEEAKSFGLNFGCSVSCGPILSRTVASIARSDREFTDDEIAQIAIVVQELHDQCDPNVRLTKAQIEALQCVADGMRHAAAAAKIGISESALKIRLASAREKLLARTTAEAIQRAKDFHLM